MVASGSSVMVGNPPSSLPVTNHFNISQIDPKYFRPKTVFKGCAFQRGVHSATACVQLASGTRCRCKPSLPRALCTLSPAPGTLQHNWTNYHTPSCTNFCTLHKSLHCVQCTQCSVHKLPHYAVALKHFRSYILPFRRRRHRAVTIPSTGGTLHLPGCRRFQE